MNSVDYCREHEPCQPGIDFALKYDTMFEVWEACTNPSWLAWMLEHSDVKYSESKLCCLFVRKIWHLIPAYCKEAIEAIEQDRLTPKIAKIARENIFKYRDCNHYAYSAVLSALCDNCTDTLQKCQGAVYYDTPDIDILKAVVVKQCEIIKAFVANPFKDNI